MGVNGNLVNTPDLVTFLDYEARRHVNTESDSELLYGLTFFLSVFFLYLRLLT